jgi:hypothetical protein
MHAIRCLQEEITKQTGNRDKGIENMINDCGDLEVKKRDVFEEIEEMLGILMRTTNYGVELL